MPKLVLTPLERLEQVRVARGVGIDNLSRRKHDFVVEDVVNGSSSLWLEERLASSKADAAGADVLADSACEANVAAVEGVIGLTPGDAGANADKRTILCQRCGVEQAEINGNTAVDAVEAWIGIVTASSDGKLTLVLDDDPERLGHVERRLWGSRHIPDARRRCRTIEHL
jgi:hypothetical protein